MNSKQLWRWTVKLLWISLLGFCQAQYVPPPPLPVPIGGDGNLPIHPGPPIPLDPTSILAGLDIPHVPMPGVDDHVPPGLPMGHGPVGIPMGPPGLEMGPLPQGGGPQGFQLGPPGGAPWGMPGGANGLGGGQGGIPSPQDIMDFIRSKYQELFPQAGIPLPPLPDPSTLFPLPDLTNVTQRVPATGFFYSFSPVHMAALREVRDLLSSGNSTTQMLDIARSLKADRNIHPHLWYYALSNLVCKNPDLEAIHKVSPVDALPDLFINAEALRAARGQQPARSKRQGMQGIAPENLPDDFVEEGGKRTKRQGQACVVVDENGGADNGIENRLWYFRESIGVNAHHWYYHIMYPFSANAKEDRHGELFYYMHASVVARYNAERLSNGLARVQPFAQLQRGVTVEGYNPHLRDDNSGTSWSSRPANSPIADIMHQNDPNLRGNVLIDSHILQGRSRVVSAVTDGFALNTRNQRVQLDNRQGIDLLGDLLQANQWSINPGFYGSGSPTGVHNNGHLVFGFLADPQYRLRLPPGVMADAAPAMRDVIFYRWHETMQQVFNLHKSRLAPYAPTGGELPLSWAGIRVTGLSVTPAQSGTANQVTTFWSTQNIRLTRGLDLTAMPNSGAINICAKELNHEEFTYQIAVTNDNNAAVAATVRIFLAPRFDESGNRFDMTTQKNLFFVLDTYGVTLNRGVNNLQRRSQDSLLTIPWAQALQELNGDPNLNTPYCGCGWPRNMLLPKGTPSGMTYDLFVMITNRNEDTVQGQTTRQSCIAAPLYCGIANQLYPDSKPMGYPFDRLPYSVNQRVVANLDEYVSNVPNMATIQMQIRFTGQ